MCYRHRVYNAVVETTPDPLRTDRLLRRPSTPLWGLKLVGAPGTGAAPRSFPAFTLVELLVVIGILTLLIAILIPALARARAMSLQTVCLSNMRQMGSAIQMYVGESNQIMPASTDPVANFGDDAVAAQAPTCLYLLLKYLNGERRILACPAIDPTKLYNSTVLPPTDLSDSNYLYNEAVDDVKITSIPDSSEIVCFQEWAWRSAIAYRRPARWGGPGQYFYVYWQSTGAGYEEYSNCHFGGGNLLFVDGHAEWRPYPSMRASDFGLTGGPGFNGNATDDWTASPTAAYLRQF